MSWCSREIIPRRYTTFLLEGALSYAINKVSRALPSSPHFMISLTVESMAALLLRQSIVSGNRHRFLVRLLFGIRKHLLCLLRDIHIYPTFSHHMIIINYFTFPQVSLTFVPETETKSYIAFTKCIIERCQCQNWPIFFRNVKKYYKNSHKLGAGNVKGDSHLLNGCPGIFNCNFYFYIEELSNLFCKFLEHFISDIQIL